MLTLPLLRSLLLPPHPRYIPDKLAQLCVCEAGRAWATLSLDTPEVHGFFPSHHPGSSRDGEPASMSAAFSFKFRPIRQLKSFLPSPSPVNGVNKVSFLRMESGNTMTFSGMYSLHPEGGVPLASYTTLIDALAADSKREAQLHGSLLQNFAGNIEFYVPSFYHSVLAPRRVYKNLIVGDDSAGSLLLCPSAFLSTTSMSVYSPISPTLPSKERRENLREWATDFSSDESYRATATQSGHPYDWSPSSENRRQQLLSSPLFAVLYEQLLLPPSERKVTCLSLLPAAERSFDCRLVCPGNILLDLILRGLLKRSLSGSFPDNTPASICKLTDLDSDNVRLMLKTPTILSSTPHHHRTSALAFFLENNSIFNIANRKFKLGTRDIIRNVIKTISHELVNAALKHSAKLQAELQLVSKATSTEASFVTLAKKTPEDFQKAVEGACWENLLRD